MNTFPLLSLVTFLPLFGALFILLIDSTNKEDVARNARYVALFTSAFTFAVSLVLFALFDSDNGEFQFVEKWEWLPAVNISYMMGVDGISMLFVLLAAFLTPLCILASWRSIRENVKEYMIAFLVLETMMIGMFCALDMVVFYIFFEAVLIPMFIIIGVWGGVRRVYAAFKFFLYTLLGSVLMLLAVLAMYHHAGTTSIPELMQANFPPQMQFWLFLAFFASFAVKIPMWPVHTWLPDAHVEAPTAGSVILAGVLLKMGGYGFLRFSVPMLPVATVDLTPYIFALSVIAIIYTSLVALAQKDMKKLIAYSSIAHMGFVTLGIFTLTEQGMEGAMFQMLSHGIVSGALFLSVGVLYDRMHTREIARYGGVVNVMPRFATFFMIFMLASVGLPGTSGFVGEFLTLVGAYRVNTTVAVLAATGVVLGAAYMLYLYRAVFFGPMENDDVKEMQDLTPRETGIFIPLAFLVLWMGIYPQPVLNTIAPAVEKTMKYHHQGLQYAAELQEAVERKEDEQEGQDGDGNL
ncbi:MAG: NADH-quinone oxidoreductase subunit M [Micavibrio sp.]|nr:MAG: NADH-quinone oxidoreductase subunit M [Micavibrio sp.]